MEGCLLLGILHIRTPHGEKSPTLNTRIRVARGTLGLMGKRLEQLPRNAVAVLAGDPNLTIAQADPAVQHAEGEPDIYWHWHIESSNAGEGGDILFVKGTTSKSFDVSIGKSRVRPAATHPYE